MCLSHTNEPTVFTQRSLGWQLWVLVTHSFTSAEGHKSGSLCVYVFGTRKKERELNREGEREKEREQDGVKEKGREKDGELEKRV